MGWPGTDGGPAAADIRARLASAEHPLVLIGLGVDNANATRIRRWLDEWNLPVAVTPTVKGMAYGLSAAIGAKLGHPDVPVNYANYTLLF